MLAVLGAGALALPLLVTAQAPAASAADPCTEPRLTDFLVSQGPAEYSGLAAGKTSLVKLFLSTPDCLPVGARVRVTGAQLTVNGKPPPVVLDAALPLPTLATSSAAPVPSTPSDVVFLVPGTAMQPLSDGTVTFAAVVDYLVTAGGTSVEDRVVWSTAPGTTNPLSATVVPGLTDVDVLVVPLGAGSDSLASQYTKDTREAVAQGFGTARRLFPTSDRGLRYTESAGIKLALPSPLCATDATWIDVLEPQLIAHRTAWNSVLGNPHMDRVLGEVDQTRSSGPSTGQNACADGYGQLGTLPTSKTALGSAGPGLAAYARAVTTRSTYGGPTAGSLIGMELAHTTGAVTASYPPNQRSGPLDQNRAVGPHSAYTSGDPRQTLRAYNTDTQELLPSPRSVMKFSGSGWHDTVTVMEKQDWDYLLCSVLPLPPGADPRNVPALRTLPPELTSCNDPGSLGFAAAAQDGTYAVSGTTDGTPGGTDANSVDSMVTTADRPVPGSLLRVVQRDKDGLVLADDGIAVQRASSGHPHEAGSLPEPERFVFGASVPAKLGTQTLQLYVGSPEAGKEPLYTRTVTARPDIRTVEAGPGAVTITVGHPQPDNLRLDLFAACTGAGTSPMVVGDEPTRTTPAVGSAPGTATFVATYDSSLSCGDGTLLYRVTDGIQSKTGTGGRISGVRTGSAEITSPAAGSVLTSLSNIGLAGRVTDAAGVEAAKVTWQLTHVDAEGKITKQELADAPLATATPPTGGWKTGTTSIALLGYNARGDLIASASRSFTIALDSDGDRIPDDAERKVPCLGDPAVLDDRTPHLDPDGDGLLYGVDGDPCVSALTITAKLSPQSLYKSANGQSVTFTIGEPQGVDLTSLAASDLYVRQIGGASVARLAGSPTALPVSSLTRTSSTTATVKVDRAALVKLIGPRLGYTPIVLGTLDDRVRGLDPASPHVFP